MAVLRRGPSEVVRQSLQSRHEGELAVDVPTAPERPSRVKVSTAAPGFLVIDDAPRSYEPGFRISAVTGSLTILLLGGMGLRRSGILG